MWKLRIPKLTKHITIKQTLAAVKGYSKEADLLKYLYITTVSSPASSTAYLIDKLDLNAQGIKINNVQVYGTLKQ